MIFKKKYFSDRVDLRGYIAEPEKALLDTFYFTKGEIDMNYLKEMRFQNLEILDSAKLQAYAERFDRKRIYRAVKAFSRYLGYLEIGD